MGRRKRAPPPPPPPAPPPPPPPSPPPSTPSSPPRLHRLKLVVTQLVLMLWKSFTYRRRQRSKLVIELLWPLFFFLILVWMQWSHKPFKQHECHFPNKALPSAGTLPWLQGIMCNMRNPCFLHHTVGETPGLVDNFGSSILFRLLHKAHRLLHSKDGRQLLLNFTSIRPMLRELWRTGGKNQKSPLRTHMKGSDRYIRTTLPLAPELLKELLNASVSLGFLSQRGAALKASFCNSSEPGLRLPPGARMRLLYCKRPSSQLSAVVEALLPMLDVPSLLADQLNSESVLRPLATFLDGAASLVQEIFSISRQARLQLRALGAPSTSTFQALLHMICGHTKDEGLHVSSLRWYEVSDFKDFLDRQSMRQKPKDPHSTSSPFCEEMFHNLVSSSDVKILWQGIKPLFMGKILYTPPRPGPRSIMAEMNQTFQELAVLRELGHAWQDLGPRIYTFFNSSQELQVLRNLLAAPRTAELLSKFLNDSSSKLPMLAGFLGKPVGRPVLTWKGMFADVDAILTNLSQFMKCVSLDKIEAVANENKLVIRALELLKQERFWAGVVFHPPFTAVNSTLPPHVRYTIRMDIDAVTRTDRVKKRFWHPSPEADPFSDLRYVWGGFVYLQDLVEQAVVRVQTKTAPQMGIYVQQMPYPCFVGDAWLAGGGSAPTGRSTEETEAPKAGARSTRFLWVLTHSLSLLITLAWIYLVAMIIKGLVHEKETCVKETMKTMGLSNGVLWLSWFISSLISFLISSALLVLILKLGNILPYSNPAIIFLFLGSFSVATISQCFLISTFFFRANLASACGGIIYFFFYLPYVLYVPWRYFIPFSLRVVMSLLSPVAFSFGCEYISLYENKGIGIQWHNLITSPVPEDHYSFAVAVGLLLLDAGLYGLATWYVEGIFPGQYGIPKPWYFPFLKSYWFGKKSSAEQPSNPTAPLTAPRVFLEKPPAQLQPSVSIRDLVKVYKKSSHMAINGLSLDFYEGQITSFLGHNGAGKTTTMGILSGLLPPTSGTAYILGQDIRFNINSIRKNLGMCPQHNVLFDLLTVEEHIWFYGRLKGLSEKQVKVEMKQLILDLGLMHKRQEQAKNLSGGMQRKLSVAIAFVGGSRVVLLDEPTTGIDPFSRRSIWDLLLKYRKGRTIILSTHSMDEAEQLGDRTAILVQGRLRCCGSPLFLKSRLGAGYCLTVVKGEVAGVGGSAGAVPGTTKKDGRNLDKSINKGQGRMIRNTDVAQLLELVQSVVPGSRLMKNSRRKVLFILPYSGTKDGTLAKLFHKLDAQKRQLGISSYDISNTTLDEVFQRVGKDTRLYRAVTRRGSTSSKKWYTKEAHGKLGKQRQRPARLQGPGAQAWGRVRGIALVRQQLRALFIKRMLRARRSTRSFFVQIILPTVFVCIALLFSFIVPPRYFKKYPLLRLQPWIYGNQITFFSNDAPENPDTNRLLSALLDEPGFGTRCMKGGFMIPLLKTPWQWNWTLSRPSPSCRCSEPEDDQVLPDCPAGAGGPPAPQVQRGTGDLLLNLTGRNISDFLVKTYSRIILREQRRYSLSELRYGGLSLGSKNSQDLPTHEDLDAMVLELQGIFNISLGSSLGRLLHNMSHLIWDSKARNSIKVWFNNKGWHSMVSYVNVANNGLLRAGLPNGTDPAYYGITVANHPLNISKLQFTPSSLTPNYENVLVSIFVVFAMSFVPASFVVFLIEERVNKAKHLQFVCGMKPITYWLGNFAWDMCNYLVSAVLVIIIFLFFQHKSYTSSANLPALVLLLLLYGWSITPLMYLASFFFNVPSTAYVFLICINLFIGINSSVATFVLELFFDEELRKMNSILKQVFLIFPQFCLGRGLMDMARNQAITNALKRFGYKGFMSPLSWHLAGKHVFAMVVQGIIFSLFTLLLQYRFFLRRRLWAVHLPPLGKEDRDVAREREKVESTPQHHRPLLLLKNLTKVYGRRGTPAVDRLCVAIRPGECFGLLGVNGAGKSSTFKMLTGDTRVTLGEAWLKGHSVVTDLQSVQQHLGYCPQDDAITDLLTGRENLEFYSRVSGIPEEQTSRVAIWGVTKLKLEPHADQLVCSYTRDNKRRLSVAIALLGSPPIVFLDEPTTGIDPQARRCLWDCILGVIREGRSVVLTSQSMEECQALCTRIAIMVNGRFRCLGSVRHLKARFGHGYTVLVRVGGRGPVPVQRMMRRMFPGIVLKERHGNLLHYYLPVRAGPWTRVFAVLASCRHIYHIEDYSVSQATLNQVFMRFAKEQSKEDSQDIWDLEEDASPRWFHRWRRLMPFFKYNYQKKSIV